MQFIQANSGVTIMLLFVVTIVTADATISPAICSQRASLSTMTVWTS